MCVCARVLCLLSARHVNVLLLRLLLPLLPFGLLLLAAAVVVYNK